LLNRLKAGLLPNLLFDRSVKAQRSVIELMGKLIWLQKLFTLAKYHENTSDVDNRYTYLGSLGATQSHMQFFKCRRDMWYS